MISTRKSIIPIDVPQLAVEHISTQLKSATSYPDTVELSKMSLNEFYFSLPSLQRDVMNNKLLGSLASGCDDCELYGQMSKIASPPPHTGRTDSHFWSFINCNNSLWLDAVKFFSLECPLISGEFMLVDDKLLDQSNKFTYCLMESMQWIRLIRRNCNLLEAWILVENISCRILELFGNSYIAFTVQQLDLFTSFILSCRESSDTLSSFHESLSLKLHYTSSSSDQQVPVLSSTDGPQPEIDSNIPESKLLVPSVDDSTLGNEVIIEQSVFREEICGEFLLSGMEWKCITQIHGDSVVFSKDWTNLFSSKIEGNFVCVLSFQYKKINKLNSRKQNSCFFRAKAVCKFKDCFEFIFVIKKEPLECKIGDNIIVEYNTTVHSRNLSHSHRLEVARGVADTSVNAYFYDQFDSVDNTNLALYYGNLSKVRSSAVLRKAKFDLSSLQRYSNDNWTELICLQQYYRNSVIGLHVRGYIQSLSHNPFIVHMYTEDQIKILKLFKDTRIVLHLDATGSIVRKIEPSLKKVFYYALTVRHPTYSTSPVPLAEMISSGHTSAEISYFLHKWSLDAKKILGDLNISQVEIDFSWVLIHSSCSIFLKCDIDTYLHKCWNMVDVNFAVNETDFKVILHLCSAHLI